MPDGRPAGFPVVDDLEWANLGVWLLEMLQADDGSPGLPVRRMTEPAPAGSQVLPQRSSKSIGASAFAFWRLPQVMQLDQLNPFD